MFGKVSFAQKKIKDAPNMRIKNNYFYVYFSSRIKLNIYQIFIVNYIHI